MPYGLKKLLEIKAERQKRREEKARLKAEKERLKKEEKKKARAKRLRKKVVQRYNDKQKRLREEYHKSIGDEKARFSIYLMKNGKRYKFFGARGYKVSALQLYHKILNENNEKVQFPKEYTKSLDKIRKCKFELMLTQKISEDDPDKITMLRNEEGKFIGNCIIDSTTHKIINKDLWLVEETFNVYGFNPQTDRKDFNFIYNNIILKNTDVYTRLFVYNNKLIHHYDDDFDMVVCKTTEQAVKLYDKIEKMIDHKKYKNIFFMGKIRYTSASWFIDELEKKTGWSRVRCMDF